MIIQLTLLWHYSDTTLTLLWHHSDTTLTLLWHCSDTTLTLTPSSAALLTALWHHSDTTLTLIRSSDSTLTTLWQHPGITLTPLSSGPCLGRARQVWNERVSDYNSYYWLIRTHFRPRLLVTWSSKHIVGLTILQDISQPVNHQPARDHKHGRNEA